MTAEEKKRWRERAWRRLMARRERERNAAVAFARFLQHLDKQH
jgi:hypothetical protein